MAKPELLAYLAGVMDSDGYFSIKKSTYRIRTDGEAVNPAYSIRIGCKQVQREAVDLLHSTFGGYFGTEKPTAKKGKPLFTWQASDLKADRAVRSLLPYLHIKKRQAKVLLRLRSMKARGRRGTYVNVHGLRWGKPATFRNRCYSPKQIAAFEGLYLAVRNLNDTRWDSAHIPL